MAFLEWISGVLLTVLLLLLLWGVAVEPRFLLDVRSEEASVPDLPASWHGETVALIADLQVGMWLDNTGMVEKAVEAALEADPGLILIAGDFVYEPDSAVIREAVSLVQPLTESGAPVLAVFGNHDFSMASEKSGVFEGLADFLESELEAAGIDVLENEAVALDDGSGGEPLYVVGLGSSWAGKSRPEVALAEVPPGAARIVLMHNAVAFRELPGGTAELALAAHTHGGQMRLPFLPSESWLDIALPREVVADGWGSDSIGAPGNRLYVNRGLGFSLVPVRFRCRPELTLFTLARGPVVDSVGVASRPFPS